MKKALIISGVFISGLIGAGFATGSEIYFYFVKYGKYGFLGIVLSAVLFSLLQYAVVAHSSELEAHTVDRYLKKIMPLPLAAALSAFSYIFMLFILSAMLSGCGEMLSLLYGIKKSYGALIMLVLTFIIITKGYKGFIMSESLMFALITAVITGVCFYIAFFCRRGLPAFSHELAWAGSAVSYTGYNMLTAIAVLCLISGDISRRSAAASAVVTLTVLIVIMGAMGYIISLHRGTVSRGAMPMIDICRLYSFRLAAVYSAAVLASMLTTAVSAGYSLISGINARIKNTGATKYFVFAAAYLLSGTDFSFMVDKLYRAAGAVSVILLFFILLKFFKKT